MRPVVISIIWHPSFKIARKLAEKLYSIFNRDVDQPLLSQTGIPVYYRCKPDINTGKLKEIDMTTADKTIIIALVDDHFALDDLYLEYLEGLNDSDPNLLILPVAFSPSVLTINSSITRLNFLRYFEYEEYIQDQMLNFRLTHEVTRFLYGLNRSEETSYNINPPAKIFISHAKDRSKKDGGEQIAKQLRNFIQNELGLNTFFDVLHISVGGDFSDEIEQAIKESTTVAIHSDKYSSRPWCQREVLVSKKYKRPIVTVNAFKSGEPRSYPYMGNVPNYHWQLTSFEDVEISLLELMFNVMRETLRHEYHRQYMSYLVDKHDLEDVHILSYPPELLTIVNVTNSTVLYPDPPIGTDEIELLESLNARLKFITPSQIM